MLTLVLTLVLSSPVLAHAGAEVAAVDWSPAGVQATFGLLLPGAEGLDWVCHEAVTTPTSLLTPGYSASPSGAWLASVPSRAQARDPQVTLYRSADGCAWDPVVGIEQHVVSSVVFVDEDVVVGVTADLEGESNGILRSVDAGLSWTLVESWPGLRLSVSVKAVGSYIWAASFLVDSPDQGLLHHSEDGGLSWSTTALDLSSVAPESGSLSLKVLAADESRAWVGVGLTGGHQLLLVDGEAQTFVHAEDGSLIDGGVDTQGGVWIVEGNRDLLYSADGAGFASVDGGVPAIGLAMDGDLAMLSSSAILTEHLVFSFTPQGVLSVVYGAQDVAGPLECPAGTEGADICGPLWAQVLLPSPDTGDGPTEPWVLDTSGQNSGLEEPEGCDCSSLTSKAGGLWALLAGLLLLRRRRS